MKMAGAVMQYTDEATGTVFQWHGGEYIDVGYVATHDSTIRNNEGIPSHGAGEFVAWECINVWDHARDKPSIERTLSAMQEACDEWLRDHEEDDDGS